MGAESFECGLARAAPRGESAGLGSTETQRGKNTPKAQQRLAVIPGISNAAVDDFSFLFHPSYVSSAEDDSDF